MSGAGSHSRPLQSKLLSLAINTAGIYVSFIVWAILQERILVQPYEHEGTAHRFSFVAVLSLAQAVCAFTLATIVLRALGRAPSTVPTIEWLKIAAAHACAAPVGYLALQHVDYITFMIAKCCKLVPVLAMKMWLSQTKVRMLQVVAVLLITLGMIQFRLMGPGQSSSKTRGNATTANAEAADASFLTGIAFVAVNLCLDGYTSALQDHIVSESKFKGSSPHGIDSFHVMANMNRCTIALVGAYLLLDALVSASPTILEAIRFCQLFPQATWHVLGFALCGAFGQLFILRCLVEFGSLVNTAIGMTRKLFSVFISSALYAHHLSDWQIAAVMLVFVGLLLQLVDRHKHDNNAAPPERPAAAAADLGSSV